MGVQTGLCSPEFSRTILKLVRLLINHSCIEYIILCGDYFSCLLHYRFFLYCVLHLVILRIHCCYMDCEPKKVCFLAPVIIVNNPVFFLLQEFSDDGNPGIKINYADDTSIDNCLSLGAVASVGPSSGVPNLTKGKKKLFVEVNSLLVVDLLL